jgi:hypothetical protein
MDNHPKSTRTRPGPARAAQIPEDLQQAIASFTPPRGDLTGRCVQVSVAFAAHCARRGLDAFVSAPQHPDAWGYTDRPVAGMDTHSTAVVDLGTRAFIVDWTAGQYGYQDTPLVQEETKL